MLNQLCSFLHKSLVADSFLLLQSMTYNARGNAAEVPGHGQEGHQRRGVGRIERVDERRGPEDGGADKWQYKESDDEGVHEGGPQPGGRP